MAGTDRSRLKRGISYLILIIFLLAIGLFALVAFRPDLLSFGSSRIASQVTIFPSQAAVEGGQWRVVSQWQNPGAMSERHLYLIEFKNIPGWIAPSPVILRQGESDAVEGRYVPIEYKEQTILTLIGSSTMAHRLVPELAAAYLKKIGADEVRKLSGSTVDEAIVQGIFYSAEIMRTIVIKGQGTISGFEALRDNSCDIAMASYLISNQGAHLPSSAPNKGDTQFSIGLDAVAVVVSGSNPVEALSMDEIKNIFSGQIDNWNQVGGPDAPINVFALDDSSGTRHGFQDIFMEGATLLDGANIIESHDILSDYVAQDPLAIGFVSLALASQCRELAIKPGIGLKAVLPSEDNIANKSYPGTRHLYFYPRFESSDTKNMYAQDFTHFARSIAGQDLVSRFGFVKSDDLDESSLQSADPVFNLEVADQKIAATAQQPPASSKNLNRLDVKSDDDFAEEKIIIVGEHESTLGFKEIDSMESDDNSQGAKKGALVTIRTQKRMDYETQAAPPPLVQPEGEKVAEHLRHEVFREYQEGIRGADHLSTVFRFQIGSAELDQESTDSIYKLVEFFNEEENQGKQAILVGFSDIVGDYSNNLSISRNRAEKVAAALKGQGLEDIVVLAAGEEDPEQSNDTRLGREKNRRVEVWVK